MIKMIFNSSSLVMEFTTLIDQKLCVGLFGSKRVLKNKIWVKYDLFLQPIEVKRWALNPTLNPLFSPGSEWRTQSLDLEKVLYPIE